MTNTKLADLLAAAHALQPETINLLTALVNSESPSSSKKGVDGCVEIVAEACDRIGGRARRHRRSSCGDLLEVRFGRRRRGETPVLVLGHLDTVWPLGTLRSMPFRIANGRAYGPGVLDMKAGVALALAALEILAGAGKPAVLLLVPDEEVGSAQSRAVTERLARGAEAVFVLEPAQGPQGAYKTARKGVGHYLLRVRGVAAHSGIDFGSGHSAIHELAAQVTRVAEFSDPARGVTVNAGVIGGGTLSNVVAAEAWAEIDVRVPTLKDAARVDRQLRRLKSLDRQCTLAIEGGLNRPPMERRSGTVKLFRKAQGFAKLLGLALSEASTGGGSDGNFTAALGIPTLDGMGAVGEGSHAPHESVVLAELPVRIALLAGMLHR